MGTVAEAFRGGGVWMYFILSAVIFGWPLAFLGALTLFIKNAKPAIIVGVLVSLMGLGTLGIGVMGYQVGLIELEEALPLATPENRPRLQEMGEKYAKYPLHFGLVGASVPLLLGLMTFGGGLTKRKRSESA